MIKLMLGIVFVQTVVRNWVLHGLKLMPVDRYELYRNTAYCSVATWMSWIVYNIMRLAPAKIALMKKMAVISGAEFPGHCSWDSGSPVVSEQLQGFSKSSMGWQKGGGTAVFKKSSNKGSCSLYRSQTYQMHAHFNILTEWDEKYCITPVFCNLVGIKVKLSAVKLQYEDITWDVRRR